MFNAFNFSIQGSSYKQWYSFPFFVTLNRIWFDFSKLMICRPTLSPPQKWSYLHERGAQCWIEWKIIFQTFLILYFLVMADYIYNLRWNTRCDIDQKKNCSKVAKFTGKMRNALNGVFSSRVFFVQLLVFQIWSILYLLNSG